MAKLTHTVSGNVASFRSADKTNIESLKCHFKPIQDFNGYSKPWPAGGGKNLLPTTAVSTVTDYGITFTVNSDGSIHASGTASLSVWLTISTITLPAGSYYVSGGISGTCYINVPSIVNSYGASASFTLTEETSISPRVYVTKNETIDNTFYPMIRLSSVSDATWEPYANICPINGWKRCNTYQAGKNLWNSLAEIKEPEGTAAAATTKRIFTPFTYCIGMAYTNHHYTDMIDSYNISNNSLTVDGYGGYGLSYAIPVTPNTQYKISFTVVSGEYYCGVNQYDEEGNFLADGSFSNMVLTTKPNASMAIFVIRNRVRGTPVTITNMQIESGNVATDYEAFKSSNIYPVTFPAGGKNLLPLTADSPVVSINTGYDSTVKRTLTPGTIYVGISANNYWLGESTTRYVDSVKNGGITFYANSTAYGYGVCMKAQPNTAYTYSWKQNNKVNMRIGYYAEDGSYIDMANCSGINPQTKITPSNTAYIIVIFVVLNENDQGVLQTIEECQVELGSTGTAYEPYTDTLYGGYVDLTTGDLVAEYHYKEYDASPDEQWVLSGTNDYVCVEPEVKNDVRGYRPLCDKFIMEQTYTSAFPIRPQNNKTYGADVNEWKAWLAQNPIHVCYQLATPVKIATLTPTEIKTLLDRNTIWSNTNSITEVTYEVIDHLNQKRASIPKQKRKVLWNQINPPIDDNGWKVYSTDYSSVTFSNNIATHEYLVDQVGSYRVSIRNKDYPQVTANHIYYASYMVMSEHDCNVGLEFSNNKQQYNVYSLQANVWQRCSFIERATTTGTGAMYIPFPRGTDIYAGYKDYIKSPIYIDLTRMFGAGNEPTLEEFEALCKLNHINLEEYQPQDLNGTEQIWYIDDNDKNTYQTIIWNQQAKAVNSSNYKAYNTSRINLTFEDGTLTSTWLEEGSEYGYAACASYTKTHSLNNYYYLSYEYYTDIDGLIGGDVGGVTTPYVQTQINQWTRYSALVKRTASGNMSNNAVYINRFAKSTPVAVGKTCSARNIIAIDITQMFGAGNEPTTASEFEQLCLYNNINLSSQPTYDATGTTMIWRIK